MTYNMFSGTLNPAQSQSQSGRKQVRSWSQTCSELEFGLSSSEHLCQLATCFSTPNFDGNMGTEPLTFFCPNRHGPRSHGRMQRTALKHTRRPLQSTSQRRHHQDTLLGKRPTQFGWPRADNDVAVFLTFIASFIVGWQRSMSSTRRQ